MWTVDWILDDAWYGSSDPDLGSPLPVTISYKTLLDPVRRVLEVAAYGGGDYHQLHLLPIADELYWWLGTDP